MFKGSGTLAVRRRNAGLGGPALLASTGSQPVVAYTAFGDAVTPDGQGGWRGGWPIGGGGIGVPPVTRYQYDGGWGYESGAWGPGPGGQGAVGGPLALWGEDTTLPPVTLQHVGWRWYQPSLGRFVQRDPVGLKGGLNVYLCCDGEAVAAVDSSGLMNDWGVSGPFPLGWSGGSLYGAPKPPPMPRRPPANPIRWGPQQNKGAGVLLCVSGTLAAGAAAGPFGFGVAVVVAVGTYLWGQDEVDEVFIWVDGNILY